MWHESLVRNQTYDTTKVRLGLDGIACKTIQLFTYHVQKGKEQEGKKAET